MKLTPREPTPEMVEAGNRFLASGKRGEILVAIWQAMHDAAPSGWQPIETALMDVPILLWGKYWAGGQFNRPLIGAWHEHLSRWVILGDLSYSVHPTYWMPLPAPPSEQTQAAPSVPSVEQELLEALVVAITEKRCTPMFSGGHSFNHGIDAALECVRAAIARAKGE